MGYPITMKEAVIKKVLMSDRPQHEIAREAGIGRSTLTYWLKNHIKDGNTTLTKKEKRPQDWTAEGCRSFRVDRSHNTAFDQKWA